MEQKTPGWDDLLALKLFPASVKNTELAYYKTKLNQYGFSLDSRKDYTKLDWELWTATLADDDATFRTLVTPLGKWLDETPTRVPLTDCTTRRPAGRRAFRRGLSWEVFSSDRCGSQGLK